MKKKNIILVIILMLLSMLIGAFMSYIIFNKKSNNTLNNESNIEISNEVADENIVPDEQQKLIDDGIYTKAFEEFEKIYPMDYIFDLSQSEELKMTFTELKNEKGYDTSFLDNYNCDLENSAFVIFQKDEDIIRSIHLECE